MEDNLKIAKPRKKRNSIASKILGEKPEAKQEEIFVDLMAPSSDKTVKMELAADAQIQHKVAPSSEVELPNVFEEAFTMDHARFKRLSRKLITIDDMVGTFDINAEYYEFPSVGDKVRGCFVGFQKLNVKNKETGEYKLVPCVLFLVRGKDGRIKTYSNGGVQLVRVFVESKLANDTMVEIELVRKDPLPVGELNVFSVTPLVEPGGGENAEAMSVVEKAA